ncbi:MAG: helix-turn-helix transcriptional regulator [Pseudobdellovibrionaceae bacterium]|nr:helix-turn-helix transcriptional regulator [Pseudobdellovibrionaceae bacterium]
MATKLGKAIGRTIRQIREKKGMTAEQLAWRNGISKGYLSRIESGERIPSVPMLEKIAKALGVPLKEFF